MLPWSLTQDVGQDPIKGHVYCKQPHCSTSLQEELCSQADCWKRTICHQILLIVLNCALIRVALRFCPTSFFVHVIHLFLDMLHVLYQLSQFRKPLGGHLGIFLLLSMLATGPCFQSEGTCIDWPILFYGVELKTPLCHCGKSSSKFSFDPYACDFSNTQPMRESL